MLDAERHLQASESSAVEELCEFLRIPSVSADPAFASDTRRAAEWLRDHFAGIGLNVRLEETPGNPIVVAEWLEAPGAPTALVYGHYDVQPPDPLDLWTTPAFEPTIRDGRIYARGATDDKGQFFTHVKSVEAWLRTEGRLPVNIRFVIEGEEEVGSANLDGFLAANRDALACDIAVVSDTSQYAPEIPAITVGLRGIVACEITLHGPKSDLHSGMFGGSIANPANAVARLVASLHDVDGRIAVAGFYDDVRDASADERRQIAELPFDEAAYLAELGTDATFGEPGFTTLERRWTRPTCDVNGLVSGYTGEGPKTIVPSWSRAKITCRLVPDQNPEVILDALRRHLEARLPPGIRMKFESQHGAAGLVFDTTGPYMQAAVAAIEHAFGKPPVMIREGGSIPVVSTFREVLGVDTLLLGWGQDTDNLHAPDEHFRLADFHRGTLASARLWQELADVAK